MTIYKPEKPKAIEEGRIFEIISTGLDVWDLVRKANGSPYLYWDKTKYLTKNRKDIKPEELWAIIKINRSSSSRTITPIKTESGNNFSWQPIPMIGAFYRDIDMKFGGEIAGPFELDSTKRNTYLINSMMEEAIASSQIEGAVTTRKAAKKLLRENRKPKTDSEKMIVNNYNAIKEIENNLCKENISLELIFYLHNILTKDTLDNNDIGRLRTDKDDIVVSDPIDGTIYHTPPSERFLIEQIEEFVKYCNDDENVKDRGKEFVHPIIKAITLHFWIGYLHPFCDGNGRLARAMFYWYMLKHNYWAISYIPLSLRIRNSRKQYTDAYIYSEHDDYDLTYFVDYIYRQSDLAINDFENYISKRKNENLELFNNLRKELGLNDRQLNLIKFYMRNNKESTTIQSHSETQNIGRLTARKDLSRLQEAGFLTTSKIGLYVHYFATEKLLELFEK